MLVSHLDIIMIGIMLVHHLDIIMIWIVSVSHLDIIMIGYYVGISFRHNYDLYEACMNCFLAILYHIYLVYIVVRAHITDLLLRYCVSFVFEPQ